MKSTLAVVVLLALTAHLALCQEGFPLTEVSGATNYSFYYIHPAKSGLQVKLPGFPTRYASLSRSLVLKGLKQNIPVLIGRTAGNVDFIIIDSNGDHDLTNDLVQYFPDTLTSPIRGNYKTLKTTVISPDGRELPVEFDYSIIKPVPLRIDHGDSLENRIHLMVRPHQYRYTPVFDGDKKYRAVLFTENIYDFTKTSSFLVVVPDSVNLGAINANAAGLNTYRPGDIVLVGKRKLVFNGVAPSGDTLFLSPFKSAQPVVGNKIGFLAYDVAGQDILTAQELTLRNWKGKYVLLDFWGTWCGPCLKLLPDLKRMHAKADKNKIIMAGICYDRDINTVKSFLKKQQIDWYQLFDPQTHSTVGKTFEITAYPSFILINPDGEIIFRDEGLTGFQRLTEQLDKLTFK